MTRPDPTARRPRRSPVLATTIGTLACVGAAAGLGHVLTGPSAATATTTVVSSTTAGGGGDARSSLVDARPGLVGFDSLATNFGSAPAGVPQSYLKTTAGVLVLVSATPAAKGATGTGFSPDGNRYAFVARDGLAGTASGPQAYVRTISTGVVSLVSGTGSTPLANTGLSVTPGGFSALGNRLAFAARDTTFGAGWQVLVKDLVSGAVTLASADSTGAPVQAAGEAAPTVGIAPDGSAVYFDSAAAKVLPGVAAGQVYRRDLAGAATTVMSRDPAGTPCRGTLDTVLATGNVVFESGGLCAPGVPRAKGNVFVSTPAGTGTAVVSASSTGTPADELSTYAAASPDGSLVAFTSFATTLGVAGVLDTTPQIYVKNLATGALTWVSRPPAGSNTGKNVSPTRMMEFAPDNSALYFFSHASNLVATAPTVPQLAFRRDLAAGKTTVVSITSSGTQANAPSVRVLDASTVAFGDDTTGQVLLRTLP